MKNIYQKSSFFRTAGVSVPSSVNLNRLPASLYIPKCPEVLNNITFHAKSFDTASTHLYFLNYTSDKCVEFGIISLDISVT